MSAYYQKSLPGALGVINSGNKSSQIYRYNIMCNQISAVSKLMKDINILMDDNIIH